MDKPKTSREEARVTANGREGTTTRLGRFGPLILVSLAACGARQNFSGTYEASTLVGPVDGGGPAPAPLASGETWVVSSPDTSWPLKTNYRIDIKRGRATVCTLTGVHGVGYELVLQPGQSCTRGGGPVTLDRGRLNGHTNLSVDLVWSNPGLSMSETGELTLRE